MKVKREPDPRTVITNTIDKLYGGTIETIITTLHRPELRPVLRKLFFERLNYEYEIEKATDKNIHLLEAILEEKAKKLSTEIDSMLRKRKLIKEIAIAENKRTYSTLELENEALKKEPLDLEALQELGIDMSGLPTDEEISSMLKGFARDLESCEKEMFKFDKRNLTKDMKEFKRNRLLRKIWQQIHRYFWSVLFLGVLIGNTVSQGAKYFLATNWTWLVLLYVVWHTIKEYVLNQLFRNRRVKLQKRHLLASYLELHRAYLAKVILEPSLEERAKQYRTQKELTGN